MARYAKSIESRAVLTLKIRLQVRLRNSNANSSSSNSIKTQEETNRIVEKDR